MCTMTLGEFIKDARQKGFRRFAEFDNIFIFMDYCYQRNITTENSISYVKEDGSGCYLGYAKEEDEEDDE